MALFIFVVVWRFVGLFLHGFLRAAVPAGRAGNGGPSHGDGGSVEVCGVVPVAAGAGRDPEMASPFSSSSSLCLGKVPPRRVGTGPWESTWTCVSSWVCKQTFPCAQSCRCSLPNTGVFSALPPTVRRHPPPHLLPPTQVHHEPPSLLGCLPPKMQFLAVAWYPLAACPHPLSPPALPSQGDATELIPAQRDSVLSQSPGYMATGLMASLDEQARSGSLPASSEG